MTGKQPSTPMFTEPAPSSAPCSGQDLGDQTSLIDAYKAMRLTRIFDAKCIALQRTGQLGTYPSCEGAEAIGVGTAKAMQADDVFVPYYRDQAAQIVRGVSLTEILQYWGGDERGSDFKIPRQDMPNCIPIATQCTHACGIASAFKIRHQKRVAVCSLGDGATSKGDFAEALNLAAVWQLPVVFVINSNRWAISVPRHLQCAAKDLTDKAAAAGFQGQKVDGNDFMAVRSAVADALVTARAGKGPGLIECSSYRLGDHTTADDASRYRSATELEQARDDDPLSKAKDLLYASGEWSDQLEQHLQKQCALQVDQAVEEYLAVPPRSAQSMFDFLYAKLPKQLQQQYQRAGQKPYKGESNNG